MAWTSFQWFVVLLMVATGSINTITTKFADRSKSVGRDGVEKNFHHPFFQAICMFVGEMMCLVVYKLVFWILSRRSDGSEDEHQLTKGNRDFNQLVLYIPAICDMTTTCMQYVGLNLTYASSFQMIRGGVIVFVAIFSIIFLKRTIELKKWMGITFVILGLGLVGLADFVSTGSDESYNTKDIIIGDILIFSSQIIAATQYVVQEKFVIGHDIPSLQAVGWEGIFGFITMFFLQIPMYLIRADRPLTQHKGDRIEDAIDALVQIGNNWKLCTVTICNTFSIAFFNFAGVSVTKEISATTRVILDTIRTVIIWCVSLAFFGESFHWLQLLGFCLLIFGMCLYNDIIRASTFSICTRSGQGGESDANTEGAVSK